jgi:CO/xanthine dehydrogenase FAD-binding subunit
VEFLRPTDWDEAVSTAAEHPGAVPVAGGTDVMVELNFDRRRPAALLDLTRVADLGQWWVADDGRIRLGAGVTYARIIAELGDRIPGLAMAARTVGSPQIRNRGTVGGNLGAASPAGDCHPVLLSDDTEVEVGSTAGTRVVPIAEFYQGVKRNALDAGELVRAVWLPAPSGPQQFCKIGTRNAMVISVAALGLSLHPERNTLETAVGSVAPTPRRAADASSFASEALEEAGLWHSRAELPLSLVAEFGRRVQQAAAPIDDVRGTASYRRHALDVMARRALRWAWDDYREVA